MFQTPVADSDGYLVRPSVCLPYSGCGAGEYRSVLGSDTELQDDVCSTIRVCVPGEEYQVSDFVNGERAVDRVCAPTTVCDPETEYVLRLSDATHDTLCGVRAFCRVLNLYELRPAVDSPSFAVNGTDTVCANYTRCPPGHYANFTGTRFLDTQCAPCGVGLYSADGLSCSVCPFGRYADAPGSSVCSQCDVCDEGHNHTVPGGYECAPGSTCVAGYLTLCSASRGSVCMACPPSWRLDPLTRECSRCAAGYHAVDVTAPPPPRVEDWCVPCTANHYCPSPSAHSLCPGLRVFERPGRAGVYDVVPSSPPGTRGAGGCNCSAEATGGGFEGIAGGIVGCTPCADGYHYAPDIMQGGVSGCVPCPVGSHSSQTTVVDLYRCPSLSGPVSPVVRFDDSEPWPPSAAGGGEGNCTMQVGARECTPCPLATPATRGVGTGGVGGCTRCPAESFWDQGVGGCRPCTPQCQSPYFFEGGGCTDATDRECVFCDRTGCHADEYPVDCPGGDPLLPSRGCARCGDAPPNSHYISGGAPPVPGAAAGALSDCLWRCDEGYYSSPGESVCLKCTVLNGTTCPGGMVQTTCSDVEQRDASCEVPCDPTKKPLRHSEWVKAARSGEGVVQRDDDPTHPNAACLWECVQGYSSDSSALKTPVCSLSAQVPVG